MTLDDRPRTVVGVMPPGFAFPTREAVVWAPLSFTAVGLSRTNLLLNVIARLRPGVSAKAARADMAVIGRQLERAYPKDNARVGVTVVEMRDVMSHSHACWWWPCSARPSACC
jgi:putative ABC transport system permease protein